MPNPNPLPNICPACQQAPCACKPASPPRPRFKVPTEIVEVKNLDGPLVGSFAAARGNGKGERFKVRCGRFALRVDGSWGDGFSNDPKYLAAGSRAEAEAALAAAQPAPTDHLIGYGVEVVAKLDADGHVRASARTVGPTASIPREVAAEAISTGISTLVAALYTGRYSDLSKQGATTDHPLGLGGLAATIAIEEAIRAIEEGIAIGQGTSSTHDLDAIFLGRKVEPGAVPGVEP